MFRSTFPVTGESRLSERQSRATRADANGAVVREAWPLLPLTDERNREIGWACLNAPLRTRGEAERLARVRRRYRLIGMTSHLTFPQYRAPGDAHDYAALCEAWCHCFRDPDAYLPAALPRLLLPYSDFTNPWETSPERFGGGESALDFVYVCPDDPWKEQAKNWQLARRCFPPLCRDLGLRGLVVGRESFEGVEDLRGRLATCTELPWFELMRHLARARMLLVTSLEDPSPRLIAEALALDTPVLIQRSILGGWHYVNFFTGAFFESERDVGASARRLLSRWTSPRAWFCSHHGPSLAGARLARFLRELDPSIGRVREVRLSLRAEEDT